MGNLHFPMIRFLAKLTQTNEELGDLDLISPDIVISAKILGLLLHSSHNDILLHYLKLPNTHYEVSTMQPYLL